MTLTRDVVAADACRARRSIVRAMLSAVPNLMPKSDESGAPSIIKECPGRMGNGFALGPVGLYLAAQLRERVGRHWPMRIGPAGEARKAPTRAVEGDLQQERTPPLVARKPGVQPLQATCRPRPYLALFRGVPNFVAGIAGNVNVSNDTAMPR